MQTKTTTQATTTNALLLLTIFNHASWSILHVAARYLLVYSTITFDSQTLLSSAKGSAAIFLYLIGIINSWCAGGDDTIHSSLSSVTTALDTSNACVVDGNYDDEADDPDLNDGQSIQYDIDESAVTLNNDKLKSTYQQSSSLLPVKSDQNHDRNQYSEANQVIESELRRQKIKYTLLFAIVSTTRASSNIASSKYTYPYNISKLVLLGGVLGILVLRQTDVSCLMLLSSPFIFFLALIASLTPIIIALLDRILLQSPFPPLLWPTIILSGFGGFLIAISQSDGDSISSRDNLIGCSLQLLSAIFSAFARILMKRTEHILTPTHIVQTNNISNCVLPLLYTLIANPFSWRAFRYLLFTPKSLIAWCTISIGVYSFTSTLQIRLVRILGPGFYSSWVAIRVLGSMILSTIVLGEGISSWLEYVGVGLMLITVSIYIVETRKWMNNRKEESEISTEAREEEEEFDNEEYEMEDT